MSEGQFQHLTDQIFWGVIGIVILVVAGFLVTWARLDSLDEQLDNIQGADEEDS